MKYNLRKRFAIFITVLLLFQMMPAALFTALADGAEAMLFGHLGPFGMYYTVQFVNEGTVIAEQYVQAGSLAVKPEDPTREAQAGEGDVGIAFDGWLSNNGALVDAPIEDDTVFTAQYRSIAKTTITVKYVLSDNNPNQVTVPPPRIYDVQVGMAAGIHEKLPIIVGYKPVDSIVTVQDDYYYITYNETITSSLEYTITYVKQAPINYQVKYWVEKADLPGTVDHDNLANFEEIPAYGYAATDDFNQQIVPPSLSARVGGPTMSNGLEVDGFTRLPLTYKPLINTHVYNELYSRNAYVLSFDVGAEGAKYIAPKSVKYGASLPLPTATDMYKPGYEFVEWLPQDVASGKMPAENITLTASWKAKTANVKVIYLIEDPDAVPNGGEPSMSNPAHYKFFDTKDVAYTVGQTAVYNNDITQITAPTGGSGANANRVIATLQGYEQGVVVKGDGSSVMKVYFKLVPFTLTFNPNGGAMPGGSTASQSFSFKYGQNLTADWPAGDRSPTKSGYKYTGWSKGDVLASGESSGTIWVTMRWTFTDKMLPASSLSGYELTARWESANTYNVEYMFNAHPGQSADGKTTDTYNGKTYIKDGIGDYSQVFYSTTMNLSPKEIEGTNSKLDSNVGVKDLTVGGVTTRRFFYDRLQYGLTFDTMTTQYGKINASRLVYFAEPLSSFAPNLTGYTDVNGTYYTFAGWYRDADLTVPINLTTAKMPHVPDQSGVTPPLTLFAKWAPSDATVSFEVLGSAYGTPQTVSAGTALGASKFPAKPTEVGYDFFGWIDLNGDPFTASTLVYKNQTIRADLRPVRVQYTVEYIFTGANGVQHLLPAKIDNSKFFGDEVTEIAPEINGYAVDGSAIGWRKLGINYDQNVITFVYKQQTVFKYNVKYLLEGTDTPVPGYAALMDQLSTSFRVVLWPKQDAASRYYPVLACQMVELKANETLDIVFYYREYTYVKYNEIGYAINADGTEKIAYTIPRETRIGDTAKQARTDAAITFEGNSYAYAPDAREVASYLVRTPSDSFTLKRYYSQACTITFSVNNAAYGSLDGATTVSAAIGKPWSSIAVPTPVAKTGYYFIKWTPAFPATISGSASYVAEFGKTSALTLVADSKDVTYDATPQTAGTGFTVLENGLPTTAYTVEGYAAEGVQATDAGTYANKLVQTGAFKVIENATGADITGGVTLIKTDGALSIAKRPVTFRAADVSYAFDGTPKSAAPYANYALAPASLPLAGNHHAEAAINSIVGQGLLPGIYPLSFLIAPEIKDASNQSVTANYAIALENGTLSITEGTTKPTVTFKANNETATYTGYEINLTQGYTVTPILGGDSTGTFITQASTQAAGAVAPGTHPITVTGAKVLWKDNASGQTTDVSAMFNIVTANGELTINAITVEADKIPIEVRADSHETSFTGKLIQFTGSGTLVSGTLGDPLHVHLEMVSRGEGVIPGDYRVDFLSVKVVSDGVDVTSSYKIAELPGNLRIKQLPVTNRFPITVRADDAPSAVYAAQTLYATSSTGTVTAGAGNMPDAWNGNTYKITLSANASGYAPGDYPLTFAANTCQIFYGNNADGWEDITANYVVTPQAGNFRILNATNKSMLRIVPENLEAVYNMQQQSVSVTHLTMTPNTVITIDGQPVPSELRVEFAASGAGIVPGPYPITVDQTTVKVIVKATGADVTAEYLQDHGSGTFTIKNRETNKAKITITPDDKTLPYNGQVQSVNLDDQGTITYNGSATLPSLMSVTFMARGTGFAPGAYPIAVVAGSPVVMQDGADVTANFDIDVFDGEFTITKLTGSNRIPVSIKPDDAPSAEYNGSKMGASVTTGEIKLNNAPHTPADSVTITFIASTDGGIAPDTYKMTVHDEKVIAKDGLNTDVTDNYVFTNGTGDFVILPKGPGSNKIAMTLFPANRTETFTGSEIAVTVTDTRSQTLADGLPIPPGTVTVTFVAAGKGISVGPHPITIVDSTDRNQFKVMAPGAGGTPKDVTDQYALTVDDGTLTIGNRADKIQITIGIVDPAPFIYDGTEKSTSVYVGTVEGIEFGFDGTALQVTVNKEVRGTDAGTYPIAFDASNVTIKLGGAIVTGSYDITTVPGTMTINKKPITTSAKLTAVRPGASFKYGETIPAPTAQWDPASLAGEGLVYSLVASPDANPRNVGSYTYTPVLNAADNKNYDVSGVTLVASGPMEIKPAELLVTPGDVWHKQGTPILASEFTYTISGYQYGETQASVGPASVSYGAMAATGNEPIGTKDDIIQVSGGLAANYDVIYNGNPGGFGISGEVFYHANYPGLPDEVVAHGEYRAQSDPVNPVDPSVLGLGQPNLHFAAWFLDAALTQPFAAGTAIGPDSIHLYAKWAPMYKMTITHALSDGEPVAEQEVLWMPEGVQYTFAAKTLAQYDPLYVMYYANGITYMYQMGKTITTLGMDTEVTIVYKAKTTPPIQTFSVMAAVREEGSFTLFADDIPTQGVAGGTGVPREPARLSID